MPHRLHRGKFKQAERDPLVGLIQGAIIMLEATDNIEKPKDPPAKPDFEGYCARASDAYRYLIANDERARQLSKHEQVTLKRAKRNGAVENHYWLETPDGEILDLNLGEGEKLIGGFPYGEGKGGSLGKDPLDPSKPARGDTKRIIAVVQAFLDATGK